MVYTDKVHLVATTKKELHEFAMKIDLKLCWFHGTRKGHPHYDLTTEFKVNKAVEAGAVVVTSKDIVRMFKNNELQK